MTEELTDAAPAAVIMAGIPSINAGIYHRLRFSVVDPVVYLQLPAANGPSRRLLILRDIELDRARRLARVDQVACPADFAPQGGLSGDRETATAQAAAECLRRAGVRRAIGDRSLPLIYAEFLHREGISLQCDPDLGLLDRRRKDPQEIAWLGQSQGVTEEVIDRACRLIARAPARADGVLLDEGQPLTSQRVRAMVDHWLLDRGYANPPSIIAGGPIGADCHDLGHGELRTGQPVIVDIFPRNRETLYYGDCTRTVVHGDPPDDLRRMHAAVCKAKRAGIEAVRAGVTGEAVHRATIEVVQREGYATGLPAADAPPSYCAMVHGTGHGVGLDCHEPPLLDFQGPPLVAGDAVTIEPGLYRRDLGGVRVEDLVIVTADGCTNLNHLPESLDWK